MRQFAVVAAALSLAVAGVACAKPRFTPSQPLPAYTATQWSSFFGTAAKARMLSQKIAKEYFLVAADVDATNNRTNLLNSINEFEATFGVLQNGEASSNTPKFANGEIQGQFDKVNSLWNEFKPVVLGVANGGTPARNTFNNVDVTSTQILETLTIIDGYFGAGAGAQFGNAGYTTAVQTLSTTRVLTQQLAKEYTLVFLSVFPGEAQSSIRVGIETFNTNLSTLKTAGINSEFSQQVAQVERSWQKFLPILQKGNTAVPTSQDLIALSNTNTDLLEATGLAFNEVQNFGRNTQVTGVNTQGGNN